MALSFDSTRKAVEILTEINPVAKGILVHYNSDQEFLQNKVIGFEIKQDGGFENVYMNIQDITPAQIERFETLKGSLPNTPFMRHKMNGITRLGWI